MQLDDGGDDYGEDGDDDDAGESNDDGVMMRMIPDGENIRLALVLILPGG